MSQQPVAYDLHLHTEFSPDSTTPLDVYAKAADKLSLHIGFLDHFELAFLDRVDYLTYDRFPQLLEAFDCVHTEYPRTSIGLEVDYYSDLAPEVAEFCDDYRSDFNYFIGVVHTVDRYAVTVLEEMKALVTQIGLRKALETYFNEVEAAIQSRLFSGIAHIDGVMRFVPLFPGSTKLESLWYTRTKELCILCQKLDILIEVNLRGLNHPWGQIHPTFSLINELIKERAKFYVGSDSHSLNDFQKAVPLLNKMHAFLTDHDSLGLPRALENG
jgi:histidinol-phosphatase (PHP family)